MNQETEIQAIYKQLINAWNHRDARRMAGLFTEDGVMIGFDGSISVGSEEIFKHLNSIFTDHPTGQFVNKVKDVKNLSSDIAMLRAIAGMIPANQSDIKPELNTHHTLIAVNKDNHWYIQLFQNTPAQFHGRPKLVKQMTEELRKLM